jgi:hypothetical protein
MPPAHLRNWRPTANPTVLLNDFFHRMFNDVLDPLQSNHGAIRTLMHGVEVLGEFHKRQSTRRFDLLKSRRPTPTEYPPRLNQIT